MGKNKLIKRKRLVDNLKWVAIISAITSIMAYVGLESESKRLERAILDKAKLDQVKIK